MGLVRTMMIAKDAEKCELQWKKRSGNKKRMTTRAFEELWDQAVTPVAIEEGNITRTWAKESMERTELPDAIALVSMIVKREEKYR